MDRLKRSTEELNRRIGQKVARESRGVVRRYAQALNEVRLILSTVFERFEQDGKLTFEEMAKYDRLNQLFGEIDFALSRNYRELYNIVYDVLGFSFAESFDMTAWAIESVAKADLSYSAATTAQITAIATAPINKLTLNERLSRNRAAILQTIRQEILLGLNGGTTYTDMAKKIKPVLEMDAAKAMRVVRTEAHRAMEGGKLDAVSHADRQGVRMVKRWNSSHDERVRRRPRDTTDHKMLDGVTLRMDENFKGVKGRGPGPGHLGHPAEDINCRCFLTYEIDSVEDVSNDRYEAATFDRWREEKRRVQM